MNRGRGCGRELVEVERCPHRQSRHPVVAVAGVEKAAQDNQVGVRGVLSGLGGGGEPGQVMLEDPSGDAGRVGDLVMVTGQEDRKPPQGTFIDADGSECLTRAEPVPVGPLDPLTQPGLGEVIETSRSGALRKVAGPEHRGTPEVTGELGLGVGVLCEVV